jgi:hypothetical protein
LASADERVRGKAITPQPSTGPSLSRRSASTLGVRENANAIVGAIRAWRWVWGYLTIVNPIDWGGELAPAALVAVMVTV